MQLREAVEQLELKNLAPYAAKACQSRGRKIAIEPDRLRTDFQRDRDRIIHCSAFRKLVFKTQVFHTTAGDYPRTRITHTMEVAQIARILARALNLNTDLAEAIALSHDMGHTPFGHAGEEAMRECMSGHGGFEHNEQGLRVVEFLEERYSDHPGLNLTYEVREGIIKHDTAYDTPNPHPDYNPGKGSSLEAQVCDLADEIAYNNADLDDALKMGVIKEAELRAVPWVYDLFERARRENKDGTRDKFVRYGVLGVLYDFHVNDALDFSTRQIEKSGVKSIEDVYNHGSRLIDFSPQFKEQLFLLKNFLLRRVYFSPKNLVYSNKAKKFVREMFNHYLNNNGLLPWKYQERIESMGKHRVVCDYVAGCTDRFLMEQYRLCFMPEVTH